jgi:methylated-DNA-[protein]-cysteine S-methyltransferase
LRAKHTGYPVPGWGVGDLWTSKDAVLAHEFRFAGAGALGGEAHVAAPGATGWADEPGPDGAGASEDFGRARRTDPHGAADAAPYAAPEKGAASPPTGTVPAKSSPLGHAFAPDVRRQSTAVAVAPVAPLLDPGELVARFGAFLAGAPVDFADVPLELDGLTPFQVAVARSLRAVPRGEVVSYAELAALAGYPRAQRAVGTFCARNRFAFLLPCHRVVGADGIGTYGSAGVAVKRRLLRLEGVVL